MAKTGRNAYIKCMALEQVWPSFLYTWTRDMPPRVRVGGCAWGGGGRGRRSKSTSQLYMHVASLPLAIALRRIRMLGC
jgi:hypothetical protein